MIERHVQWNDDIGEWQLRCVAYTGNNMRKQTPQPEKEKEKVTEFHFDLHDANSPNGEISSRPLNFLIDD